ncbi:2-amino-4-hydroxy-6-hydroxymethyldihydropteridine diphosphokinase [Phyllobacterium brassicacearum]|uniref:2-amino-4-hydroxy-6-hydroxymethyldihydropteridine pyrophosphokinase n=1 Tax=Phyllobacterium brassicacearum TaxID=314235 RepID=A0A2P7BTJ4_9HYPH|nr:2-amino-4-hydroxy-6-hydroxymethyldihydropteridine diphosphokinase [Phyllobacterium brassicacearum]PSH69722.1 2-amino-4-hydroxy-6-hydroxymethyldihydropteridine diphosphokinase [Phyllobacterium brassicacearum]TDQ34864.1 2-amino-4-hydroxy-6-hydroxymethyldihydropteridine diphosphokinase [Phyllobacterium brassicacearum]
MHKAWLGLGGNVGDPVASMGKALRALHRRSDTRVRAVSAVYKTPPWGKTDQAWFHNACAEVETLLAPEALLATCLDIEKRMKRQRIERWGPRIIDIDVLAYEGEETFGSPTLVLPHPRMTERAFVMVPLSDIAPQLAVSGRSVAEWSRLCDRSGIEKARSDAGWWRQTP